MYLSSGHKFILAFSVIALAMMVFLYTAGFYEAYRYQNPAIFVTSCKSADYNIVFSGVLDPNSRHAGAVAVQIIDLDTGEFSIIDAAECVAITQEE